MVRLSIHALFAVALTRSAHVAAAAAAQPLSARHGQVSSRATEDAPTAPNTPADPVILQPLRNIPQRNSKRDRTNDLQLKSAETLYWGGQDGTMAKLRIEMPGETENIVNLESIDDMVTKVTCPSTDAGQLKLQFAAATDFNSAQDVWKWVNDAAENHFLLLVGAGTCGWNAERIVYNVTDLVYNNEAETAVLQAQRTTWKDAVHTFDLTLGNAAVSNNNNITTTPATRSPHRRHPANLARASFSPSFTIPLSTNLTSKSLSLTLPSPSPLTASATCITCATAGDLEVQAHFASRWFKLTAASIEVSLPSPLTATAVLDLGLQGALADPVTKTVPLFQVSPGGVSIPGIVTLGPTVGVSLGMQVGGVTGRVGVTMGGTAVVEGGSVGKLDFLNKDGGEVKGWRVDLRPAGFKADASVQTTASVFLRAAVGVEASIFETGFAAQLSADAPSLSATLKAMTSTNCTVCGHYQNGVQGSLNFGTSIGASLTKKVAGSDSPLWSVTFAQAKTPAIAGFCQGFGLQGQECLASNFVKSSPRRDFAY